MIRFTAAIRAAVVLTIVGFSSSGSASPPDEWDQFRENTRAQCIAELRKVEGQISERDYTVRVAPFGSESFGLALLTVRKLREVRDYVCVMDKRTLKAEIADIE